MGLWPAALTVFGVFLREGVEVMILLWTMNAIVKRPLPIVAGGATGVAVTLAGGVALGQVGQSVVAGNTVSLMAAALLLYLARGLIFWRAMSELPNVAGRLARVTREPWPLFGLALILSGRETVDLMIFVEAITLRAGGWSVHAFAAIAVAGLCLAVVYSVLDRLAGKLPLRLVFVVSSIWLVVQAALLIWDVIE